MKAFTTLLITDPAPRVRLVMMNRPDSANALNTQMGRDLIEYFEDFALNSGDCRCIVLTGAGTRTFCAGGDLRERNGMSNEAWERQHLIFERMMRALLACPVPLIGAINGAAFGGGSEIALACDFLYAADTARFAFPEVSLGIMPGCGGTQLLPRAVGERRAKELILTSRPFTADQAEQWGMVNHVLPAVQLMDRSLEAASAIAATAPLSAMQAKRSIHHGLQMSLPEGLAFEIEAYNRLVPTEDRKEGILAFNEKRLPIFHGR